MITTKTLDILLHARNHICLDDYIEIWGEHLGHHIWQQLGNDLLRIWGSGLQTLQRERLIDFINSRYSMKLTVDNLEFISKQSIIEHFKDTTDPEGSLILLLEKLRDENDK